MKKQKTEGLLGYEVKIIPDQESGYFAIRFPDFPGIITGGYDLKEAIENAQEALKLTGDTMSKHRIPLPRPRTRFSGQFRFSSETSIRPIPYYRCLPPKLPWGRAEPMKRREAQDLLGYEIKMVVDQNGFPLDRHLKTS